MRRDLRIVTQTGMSTLALYKAFKAMGATDEAAEQAATAVDEYHDLSRLETKIDKLDVTLSKFGDGAAELKSDVKLLKWMVTSIGGLILIVLIKLFIYTG